MIMYGEDRKRGMTPQYLLNNVGVKGMQWTFAIGISIVWVRTVIEEEAGNVVVFRERDGTVEGGPTKRVE